MFKGAGTTEITLFKTRKFCYIPPLYTEAPYGIIINIICLYLILLFNFTLFPNNGLKNNKS